MARQKKIHQTRRFRWILFLALVLGLIAWSFTIPWKLNVLRGTIEQRVQAATGRALQIEGDIWWHWGWHRAWFEVNGLRFANPDWTGRPDMLTAEQVQAWISLRPLLSRRGDIPEVRVLKPDLWLETSKTDQRNWYLDTQQSDGESAVQLGRVMLDQGRLHFVQKHLQTDVQVDLQTLMVPVNELKTADAKSADAAAAGQNAKPVAPSAEKTGEASGDPALSRIRATAKGTWHGLPLQAQAEGDDVLKLAAMTEPYRLDVSATVGRTRVSAAGTLAPLAGPTSADLRVSVQGQSLGEWYRIVGVGLPDSPPYRTSGRVRLNDKIWRYEEFKSQVGSSDLGGSLAYEPSEVHGQRPLIRGQLISQRLDLKDLGPVIGLTPTPSTSTPPPSSEKEKPKTAGATGRSAGKILPQQKFSSEKWDTLDADIKFEGRAIRNVGEWPIDDLNLHVKLDNKRLTLDPFSLGVAGGALSGSFSIDGRETRMPAAARINIRRMQLARLLPQVRDTDKAALGSVNGRIALDGRGESFAEMLGTANGEVQLAMGRGSVSNLLLEVVGLDISQSLGLLVRGDRNVEIQCALIDTGWKDGLLSTRAAVFDTKDTVIQVTGGANFKQESLDLAIKPVAKDPSLLSLRVPFYVKGSFSDPSISPDKGRLLLRGGGAILLGLINPLAAIIPLIETGPGQDSDCGALLKRVRSDGVPVSDRKPAAGQGTGR